MLDWLRARWRPWGPPVLVGALVVVTLVRLARRLVYGVDLEDEGFYVALATAVAHGRLPMLDDLGVGLAPLFTAPISLLHGALRPRSVGIVLAHRAAFLVAWIVVCAHLWSWLRRHVDPLLATVAALVPLTFWPFRIPSLAYNTLAAAFFLLAAVGLARCLDERRRSLVPPALALGAASLCYPTLVLPGLVLVGLFLSFDRRLGPPPGRARTLWALAAVACVSAALLVAVVGPTRLAAVLAFLRGFGAYAHLSDRVTRLPRQALANAPSLVVLGVWAAALAGTARRSTRATWVAAFALPPLWWLARRTGGTIDVGHVLVLALGVGAAPIFLRRETPPAVRLVGLSGLVAGLATAWSSSNGWTNFPIGGLTAAVAALAARGNLDRAAAGRHAGALLVAVGLVVLLQTHNLYQASYGDSNPVVTLDTKVISGPYAGLRTGRAKAEFVARFEADLREATPPEARTIAVYDYFPGGTLFSPLRIAAPALFVPPLSSYPIQPREMLAAYYRGPASRAPDLLVWMSSLPIAPGVDVASNPVPGDPLREALFSHDYRPAVARSRYVIYRRAGAP